MFLKPEKPSPACVRKHGEFVRSLNICIAENWYDHKCNDVIQSCHVKHGKFSGLNLKPHNREIPMCAIHHTIQGSKGEVSFWGERLEEVKSLANAIGVKSGDRESCLKLIHRFQKK